MPATCHPPIRERKSSNYTTYIRPVGALFYLVSSLKNDTKTRKNKRKKKNCSKLLSSLHIISSRFLQCVEKNVLVVTPPPHHHHHINSHPKTKLDNLKKKKKKHALEIRRGGGGVGSPYGSSGLGDHQ